MKITMQQIAEKAGVTRATVDKVVHGRPGVSPATKERIQKILLEYDYRLPLRMPAEKRVSGSARVAVVTLHPSHDSYMKRLKAGMDHSIAQCYGLRFEAEYYYYDASNPESLLSIIDYLRQQEIDALALRGMDYPGVADYLESLFEKKIPVITFDSDMPESGRLCFVGENLQGTGRVAASLIGELVGGRGKVAVIGSSRKVNSAAERIRGFQDYMEKEYPDVEVLEPIETLDQHAITYRQVCRLMEEHPRVRGIWNSARCSEDVARALADCGREKEVKLVSVNLTPEVISLVERHIVSFATGHAPYVIGEQVIRVLYEYLYFHRTPEKEHIRTPVHIISKANLDAADWD